MNRIITIFFFILMSSIHISAHTLYDSLRNTIIQIGKSIDTIQNVPVIGKLTNFLPFTIISKSFQECPGQSLLALVMLSVYIVCNTKSFCKTFNHIPFLSQPEDRLELDDSIFIFEGDDEKDGHEQENTEDEFLFEDSKQFRRKHVINK